MELHAEVLVQTKSNALYPAADGGLNFVGRADAVEKVLLGGQWSPDKETNIVMEFFHFSDGYNLTDWNRYESILNTLNTLLLSPGTYSAAKIEFQSIADSQQVTKRQNYIFLRFLKNKCFFGSDFEVINFVGLDDGSCFQRLALDYSFFENFSGYLQYIYTIGLAHTEFYEYPFKDTIKVGVKYIF